MKPSPIEPLRYWPQIELWLRGHLDSSDRLALLALCGYPVGSIGHAQGAQMQALEEIFHSRDPELSVEEAEWQPAPLPLPKPE